MLDWVRNAADFIKLIIELAMTPSRTTQYDIFEHQIQCPVR